MSDYFEITKNEHKQLQDVINFAKQQFDNEFKSDGYNIRINCGEVSGQTVFNLHVHLIPRYKGDMDESRGRERGVIPEKKKY